MKIPKKKKFRKKDRYNKKERKQTVDEYTVVYYFLFTFVCLNIPIIKVKIS